MKTGIIQLHCTQEVSTNRKRLAESIARVAEMGAELVVLQELHDSLYRSEEHTSELQSQR